MEGLIAYKMLFSILHLFGVILGAGGAFASDGMFFSAIKDERITKTEMRFLRLGSAMVWAGLGLVILSGILLFLANPDRYIHSLKFLLKMIVVASIATNGLVFYSIHIPFIERNTGKHFPCCDAFVRRAPYLLASGAISLLSWTIAVVLGAMRGIPLSLLQGLVGYVALVVLAIAISLLLKNKILPKHRDELCSSCRISQKSL